MAGEARLQARRRKLIAMPTLAEDLEERYARLFECAPLPCMVTDAGGTIHEANPAAAQLLGVGAAALRGQAVAAFVPLEQRRMFRARLDGMGQGATWRGKLRARDAAVQVELVVAAVQIAGERLLCWQLRELDRA